MSYKKNRVTPNTGFYVQCKTAFINGTWSSLPHNWQARLTYDECYRVYRAKAKEMLLICMKGADLPRNWNKGLNEKEILACYRARGYDSLSTGRYRSKKAALKASSRKQVKAIHEEHRVKLWYYKNYRMVHAYKTCGAGVHDIYSDDKRRRRHNRRFLSWYFSRNGMPKPTKNIHGFTRIPGRISGDYYLSGSGYLIVGPRGKCRITEEYPNVYHEYDDVPCVFLYDNGKAEGYDNLCLKGCKFIRDGMPNFYDYDAKEYDDMCFEKNKAAFAKSFDRVIEDIREIAKEQHNVYEAKWELRKEVKRARSYGIRCDHYEEVLRQCGGWKNLEYAKDVLMKNCKGIREQIGWTINQKIIDNCRLDNNTASENQRQLRALGFVA